LEELHIGCGLAGVAALILLGVWLDAENLRKTSRRSHSSDAHLRSHLRQIENENHPEASIAVFPVIC
jgi:hypothetical protein